MAEFPEAVYNAMNEVCGTAPERTQWGYVNPNPPYGQLQADALEALLLETETIEEIDALVDRLRDIVQPLGCLPFFHRTGGIDSPKQNKVVVIHAHSILEIADVTCLTSAGVNYDIDDDNDAGHIRGLGQAIWSDSSGSLERLPAPALSDSAGEPKGFSERNCNLLPDGPGSD